MLEIRHLRSLLALKTEANLQQAAQSLDMTQSALSHQIKELESKLGLPLLNRRTRPAQLTTAALRIIQLAQQVLPLVDQTQRELAKLAKGQTGRLYLAIDCHSCFEWLMPTLNAYRLKWPDISLDLSAAFSFNPLPALQRGDLDLVITSDPQPLAGIDYLSLFSYELILAVGHEHKLAKKKFVQPSQLATETLITYPVEHDRLDIFTQFLDPAQVEPAHVRHAELTPMIIQLVSNHRGVAALPSWTLSQAIEYDWLSTCHLGKPPGIWVTLYAAVRQEDASRDYIHDFLYLADQTCFKTLSGIRKVKKT